MTEGRGSRKKEREREAKTTVYSVWSFHFIYRVGVQREQSNTFLNFFLKSERGKNKKQKLKKKR